MAVPRFRLKAAAVHSAPVYMDKEATTAKVVNIIQSAGKQGIKLLVFPETFIPGYPYFIEAYPPLIQTQALSQYAHQSVVCDASDPSIQAIQEACRTNRVTISLGVSERLAEGYTLFNSQVHIDSGGAILGVHRKLQPTYAERYVWGQGDGSTLRVWRVEEEKEEVPPFLKSNHKLPGEGDDDDDDSNSNNNKKTVNKPPVETSGHHHYYYNLGGLCCWENTMNGARQALIEQNQHVHAGAWPALSTMAGFDAVADAQIEALMKTHALTAQVFVLCASNYVDDSCLAWMDENLGRQEFVKKGGGWSAVIHPFCSYLAGPHTGGEEELVVAELDFDSLGPVKVWIDGNGHYKRPEILEMTVNRKAYISAPKS